MPSVLRTDRVRKLAAYLLEVPDEKFTMSNTGDRGGGNPRVAPGCGTPACVGGHICYMEGINWFQAIRWLVDESGSTEYEGSDALNNLFCPEGWAKESRNPAEQRYTRLGAVETLLNAVALWEREGRIEFIWPDQLATGRAPMETL